MDTDSKAEDLSSSAAQPHRALLLPEIVSCILARAHESCQSTALLASTCKVCRLWARESARIYWQSPPAWALALAPLHRRPAYARHVRYLNIWLDRPSGSCWCQPQSGAADYRPVFRWCPCCIYRALRFPRLQWLRVRSDRVADVLEYLRPCFQPHLVALDCTAALLCAPPTAALVAANCPRLRTLRVALAVASSRPEPAVAAGQQTEAVTQPRFLAFLQRCASLTRLVVDKLDVDLVAEPAIFAHLAGRPSLEELAAARDDAVLPAWTVRLALLSNPSGAFLALRRLALHAEAEAVELLASAAAAASTGASLARLSDLRVRIRPHTTTSRLLTALAACAPWARRLEVLHVQYHAPLSLDVCDILALGRLTQLRALGLWSTTGDDGAFAPFSGERACVDPGLRSTAELQAGQFRRQHWAALLTALSGLRELCFEVGTAVASADSLALVGRLCPRMEKLSLNRWYDVRAFEGENAATPSLASFTHLTVLRLKGTMMHDDRM
jgi:hypothetical protein